MGFSGLVAVVALATAVVFAILNPTMLFESRLVAVPGGEYAVPLIGLLLAAAAATILLMLVGEAAAAAAWGAARARLRRRIEERDRELNDLKAEGVVEVDREIDELRGELSARIDALAGIIEARLPAIAVPSTLRDDHSLIERETTVTRREP